MLPKQTSGRRDDENDKKDKDYVPHEDSADDTEDEGDEEHGIDMADELREELAAGDIEITDLDGNIHIHHVEQPLSAEEQLSKDGLVMAATIKDVRWEENTNKRKLVFNDIMKRSKASSLDRFQVVIEFTDDWKGLGKISKRNSAIIQCSVGRYIQTGTAANGTPRLRELSEQEMKQMGSSGSPPCSCKTCVKRRENDVLVKPAIGLRNGKKLGWDKYGEGHRLSDG